VLALWGAIVALAIPLARHESDHLTLGGYSVRGSQSSVVSAVLQRDFPELSPTDLAVLLWPTHGATATDVNRAIHRIEAAVSNTPHISLTAKGREEASFAAGLVGPIIIPLQVHVSEDAARNLVRTLRKRLGVEAPIHSRIEVHLLGESALAGAVAETSQHELATAERISFPLLLGVLLVVFGSLIAAVLPVTLGAAAVVVAASIIYGLSHGLELSVFTANTASMFGIGVAVDYSLLVLARLRQELEAGRPFQEALEVATATAGRAVVFSGAIVVTSLAGVWLVPIDVLRSMAAGAMIVVAVSVVASITLLPALIVTLGEVRLTRNFLSRTRPRRRRKVWRVWARTVTGHPVLATSLASGVLLLLAAPALQMTTGTGTLQQLSKSNETRIGFTEAAKQEGPGALGPIVVTLEMKRADVASLRRWAAGFHSLASKLPGVRESSTVQVARSAATFFVVPVTGPESVGAQRLVQRLRRSAAQLADAAPVSVAVGGAPGSLLDEEQAVRSSTWKVLAILLVTSFVILFAMLRSVLLPVKAVVMNLLSVGAAYGALVIVFQWGWLDALFHYQAPGHIYTLVPPLVLAVVFGLSMDYEVFLLTRIRECWLTSGDAQGAVAEGLEASARTIASAAFILVCVFAVFVGTGVPTIKELGVGAGVAVAVDATLIRLILVPATMELFGAWNWWMPRPLDRILPRWASVRATAGRQTQQAASAREAA
jgi:uncharacterized membrane protein YdfJ with MMPL/SSD domain